MLDPEFSTDSRCPGVTSPFPLSIPGRTKTRIETSVSKLRTSMCFEKHTVNRCIHQGGSNMIRRGKRMRPFRRIAFNFCNITNTAVTFRGAAGVGRLAADAEDRNSKNCRRRRRLFKTLVVQDVITDAVLSPDIIDAAPSNRSKKKPQPTPRHCKLTGLNHALTYSTLALYLLALRKIEALSVYRASGMNKC